MSAVATVLALDTPADSVRLRFFTVDLPSEEARRAVLARLDSAGIGHTATDGVVAIRDPWQNVILLQVGPAAEDQAALDRALAASR